MAHIASYQGFPLFPSKSLIDFLVSTRGNPRYGGNFANLEEGIQSRWDRDSAGWEGKSYVLREFSGLQDLCEEWSEVDNTLCSCC